MKFISTIVATKAVLIFLCATLTIEETSCTSNITEEHFLQQNSPSKRDVNKSSTIDTIEAELLQSAVLEETIVQQNATATASKKRTCACDDNEEGLVCASNGVTYKNTCRFECAKARVSRLRQVKQGRCSQAAGAQSYWQSKSG